MRKFVTLSLIFLRKRSDDQKYVCCSQAIPGGTPLCKTDGYVGPLNDWFLWCVSLKTGIDCPFGLETMVLRELQE